MRKEKKTEFVSVGLWMVGVLKAVAVLKVPDKVGAITS